MRTQATVTVVGKDRTGVVARVTTLLFQTGANIEALEEQVSRGWFSMALVASWAGSEDDLRRIERGLLQVGKDLGMEVRVRWARRNEAQRMAIFVTKETHCLEALLAAAKSRRVRAEPVVVIGNRRDLKAHAEAAGVPFKFVPFTDRPKAEARALKILDDHDADFIVLARFMKILSPGFCWRWRNKIINIHPSLLPSFPGASAYRQAYDHGVRVVGVTSHFVTPDLDQGPIIAQDAFRIRQNEPLASIVERGQRLESKVLLEAVRLYLSKRLDVHWGRVWVG